MPPLPTEAGTGGTPPEDWVRHALQRRAPPDRESAGPLRVLLIARWEGDRWAELRAKAHERFVREVQRAAVR